MRISRLEYKNFRNYRDEGRIDFATDGRVTIIYGKNGDGKTTMHQLMQWIVYGVTKFLRRSNDIIYNTSYASEVPNGSDFDVWGRMHFTHAGENYIIHRTAVYKKSYIGEISFDTESLSLWILSDNGKTEEIKDPETAMEKILPSELKEYFFFDGEGMIQDLNYNTTESAKRLKHAIYSLFDLDILNMAVTHIGDTDHKETVLGKLYLSRGDSASRSEIQIARTNLENAQALIEQKKEALTVAKEIKKNNQEISKSISEQIGASRTKAEYEKERKSLVDDRDRAQKQLLDLQGRFGDEVYEKFTKQLIAKKIADARKKIKMKIDQINLPDGINNRLLDYLLSSNATECICGNPLCEQSRQVLKRWRELLPPKSYALLYHDFTKTANAWGMDYDRNGLISIIKDAGDTIKYIDEKEERIIAVDEAQKMSPDISQLVEDRQKAEAIISQKDEEITMLETELRKAEIYQRKMTKEFDALTAATAETQRANRRIAIMDQVKQSFSARLEKASSQYSKELQKNIQSLLDRMLNAIRIVDVSPEFAITVTDPDRKVEAKSGGQFAVISFAFIGGIYKLLQSVDGLREKDFPLVLDAPFSKLDAENEQSVVDTLPSFAPQLILFSKDTLEDKFDPSVVGKKWTIMSNAEKNISVVREGYHWN